MFDCYMRASKVRLFQNTKKNVFRFIIKVCDIKEMR